MLKLDFLLICLLLVSCQSNPPAQLKLGTWGSETASMTVSEQNAGIQFTCAFGSIPSSIALDDEGAFRIVGTYSRSSGAPPPDENFNRPFPAVYSGRTDGNLLELKIEVDSLDLLLSHTLYFGNNTIVPLCP